MEEKRLTYVKIFLDYYEAVSGLTSSEQGRLFMAILACARGEEPPKLCGNERHIFPLIKNQIARDQEAYRQLCVQRRAAGQASAAARAAKRETKCETAAGQAAETAARKAAETAARKAASGKNGKSETPEVSALALAPQTVETVEKVEPIGSVQTYYTEQMFKEDQEQEANQGQGRRQLQAPAQSGAESAPAVSYIGEQTFRGGQEQGLNQSRDRGQLLITGQSGAAAVPADACSGGDYPPRGAFRGDGDAVEWRESTHVNGCSQDNDEDKDEDYEKDHENDHDDENDGRSFDVPPGDGYSLDINNNDDELFVITTTTGAREGAQSGTAHVGSFEVVADSGSVCGADCPTDRNSDCGDGCLPDDGIDCCPENRPVTRGDNVIYRHDRLTVSLADNVGNSENGFPSSSDTLKKLLCDQPPTFSMVARYFKDVEGLRDAGAEAEQFIAYNDSLGWKNRADWKEMASRWARRSRWHSDGAWDGIV